MKKNKPFICFSTEDEKHYESFELPISVVVISEINGLLKFSLNGESIDLEYVLINFVGFVSLSRSGLKIAKRLEQMWVNQFGLVIPEGLDLSSKKVISTNDSLKSQIMSWLITKLTSERAIIASHNVQLQRDLALIRNEYEEIQSSFQRLEIFFYDVVKQPRWDAFILDPIYDRAPFTLYNGDTLIQRIPCDSSGLCDIAINIVNQKIQSQGILNISLECIEDESVVASWCLSSKELTLGWNRLSLTQSLGVDARTPQLRLEWNGNEALQLGKSVKHPDNRFSAILNHISSPAVLALKVWKFIAGTSSALPSDGHVSRGSTTRGWIVSQEQLAKAINPDYVNFEIRYLNDNSALLVHPQPTGISFAKLETCFRAGAKHIMASIKTIAEDGPKIEYAIALAKTTDSTNGAAGELPIFREGFHSEWIRVEAMRRSQIHLFLPYTLDETADLYLMTRMPLGTNDCRYGWATFSDIYATS